MTSGELLRELIAASRLAEHPDFAAELARCGIGARGPVFGLATVETDGRFYAPCPEGKLALINGVWEEDGGLIDLVATSVRSRAMRRRRGEGRFIGGDAIERARWSSQSLHLYTDAWSWMHHGCAGAVVLDWSGAVYAFHDIAGIVCESELLCARLKRAYHLPVEPPPIFVPLRTSDTSVPSPLQQHKEARHG